MAVRIVCLLVADMMRYEHRICCTAQNHCVCTDLADCSDAFLPVYTVSHPRRLDSCRGSKSYICRVNCRIHSWVWFTPVCQPLGQRVDNIVCAGCMKVYFYRKSFLRKRFKTTIVADFENRSCVLFC